MLNRQLIMIAAALALLANCRPAFSQDAPEPVKVKMSELPEAVHKAIRAQLPKGNPTDIEKSAENGEVSYDVEIKKGGRLHSFTLDEDGTLVDEGVPLGEVPAAVQAGIRKATGTAQIEGVTKVFEDAKTNYGVEVTAIGKTRAMTFDQGGVLREQQLFTNELPAAILRTIQKEPEGAIGEIVRMSDDDGITYEVEMGAGEKSRTVIIGPQGEIVAREKVVAMRDLPEAVQAAIAQQAKGGRAGGVTEHVEDGDTTYDVEIKHDEKWETVSLGTDGKTAE